MRLIPNNWLYNAGLVGLLRILQAKGVNVEARLSDDDFELHEDDLENFSDVYCTYVLRASLERFLPWLEQKDRELLNAFGANYIDIRIAHLEKLREELRSKTRVDQAEQNVRDAVATFANELKCAIQRGFEEQLAKLEQRQPKDKSEQKEIQKARKELEKNYERAKKTSESLLSTTKAFDKQKYIVDALKRFYFNKDVIGNYSLARGQTRVQQFGQKYVVPARCSLDGSNHTSKIYCKFCGCSAVDLTTERLQDAVFNEGMFSISGLPLVFKNFFYQLIPDLFVCNVCELVLLCAWAGFNQIPWRLRSGEEDTEYLFVNLPSLPLLFEQNNKVQTAYEQAQMPLQDTIYEDVMADLFSEERKQRSRWVLQNVLFVEIRTVPSKQRDKPVFKYFHVGKDVAELFTTQEASRSFRGISGRLAAPGDRKGTLSLQLKREVIKRFLSGDQIYDLVYQVCRQSLDDPRVGLKSIVEMAFLHSLRQQIWHKYRTKDETNSESRSLKGGTMEPRQIYGILRGFYNIGASLGEPMKLEKRQRLSYRLMSVVRSGKYAEFYDMLMKMYVDYQRPIPPELLSLLNPNDAIEFESKAYALLSGFLGEGETVTAAKATVAESTMETGAKIPSEEGENNG